jgi:hypothetical protein
MDQIFWIPIGVIAVGLLLGSWIGASSRSSSARSGALVGLYLGVMATFPLIAIGLANT